MNESHGAAPAGPAAHLSSTNSRPSRTRWIIREPDQEQAASLSETLNISPVVAGLLISRGYADPESAYNFLNPSYDQLHDPALMLGMPEAVRRILHAIDLGEKILVYGDYDVDGTTGTVVLRRALGMLGAETGFHVPHRFTEGYGIQQPALERALSEGFGLVVSVDCGIRAFDPLYWARDHGLDVIVTDHHLPDEGEGPPPAFAVLNPNQLGCNYPDKNLAGVGVAFKLAHALFRERGRESQINGFLKMVAIGTVADVARLVGENRAIVSLGLADLPNARNPGLRALLDVAGCNDGQPRTAYDLGFRLGPRINAAGRMDAASAVVQLFETKDQSEAKSLAEHLDSRNRERRSVQLEIEGRALAEFEGSSEAAPMSHVAVIAGDGWHRGVIGIAASKIAEKLHRPCVVISLDGDDGHGSARSIEAYHLLDGLTVCADLFEKFGGHSHAAGLSIKRENIPEFRRRLNEHAASHLSDEDMVPSVRIDAKLPANEISLALADDLLSLEPFGAGNPRPLFMTDDLHVVTEPRVVKEKHLKFRVAGRGQPSIDTIWWGGLEALRGRTLTPGEGIELAYTIEPNTWQGETRLQLCVRDVRTGSE
ncbi:MAG: single-stranded-DNA-specific exonuclease [Acidobacteriota bacterium]|jgi:single-stranded-DNA-specific exonuclease|nr:single-stranded-DNA-specific exonuclease [Acidobacteriota bacterium]